MGSNWREATIEEVSHKVAMGPFGSSIKVETFVPEGIPVISGQHLWGMKLNDQPGFNFITEEHAQRLKNANVQRGDVIFTHAGSIGQAAYIPNSSAYERYIISQRQFYMRCDTDVVIPEYVVAFFKTPEGQHKLLANAVQTGVPSIAQPVSYLRTIMIPVPPLSEQKAITHILGTLDDKIELNRKKSETLEAMARALFKSWFVDFDPVIAKMEGRWKQGESLPGMPAGLWDLFPDKLVDSELGEIPEGWKTGFLGDIASSARDNVMAEDIGQDTPYIGLEHMPKHCIALSDWGQGESVESNKHRFQKGDILFGKLRPYFHKVGIAPVDGVCSTDIVVVRPRISSFFGVTLGFTSSNEFVDFTNMTSTGTRMPRTSWTSMANYELAIPSIALAESYNCFVTPLLDRILANTFELHTLSELRDALLPKLISGELRVKGAEKLLDKAGV